MNLLWHKESRTWYTNVDRIRREARLFEQPRNRWLGEPCPDLLLTDRRLHLSGVVISTPLNDDKCAARPQAFPQSD